MSAKEKIYPSSGNVFADIGLRNPERLLVRSRIMSRVTDLIRQRGLTQQQAAKVLGIPQSKVSCLMNGKLSMFSLDDLLGLLNRLDINVEIVIRPKTQAESIATTQVFETLELLAVPGLRKSMRQARADIRAEVKRRNKLCWCWRELVFKPACHFDNRYVIIISESLGCLKSSTTLRAITAPSGSISAH